VSGHLEASGPADGARTTVSLGNLTDAAAIGRMNDAEFDRYWTALGTVVRLACRAAPAAERERCAQIAEQQQELRSGPAIAALIREDAQS